MKRQRHFSRGLFSFAAALGMIAMLLSGRSIQSFADTTSANSLANIQARNVGLADWAKLTERMADEATPMTWLFAGDSITQGVAWTYGLKRYTDYFEDSLRTDPLAGHDRSKDVVINTGVSLSTTDWLIEDLAGWVTNRHPDVVFLAFGMNDGRSNSVPLNTFISNLTTAISAARSVGAIPVLMTQNYTLDTTNNGNLTNYFNAVRSLAESSNVMLVDFAQYWLDVNAGNPMNVQWMGDTIHPNYQGHLKWAQFIFSALGLDMGSSRLDGLETAEVAKTGSAVTSAALVAAGGATALQKLKSLYTNTDPTLWSFLGGATTQGTLAEASAKNWVELFDEVLRWEHGASGNPKERRMKFVQNVGLNGLSSVDLLKRYQQEVADQNPVALFISPDVIYNGQMIESDATTFKNNITSIVQRAVSSGAVVVLVTPPQLDDRANEYATAMQQIANSNTSSVVLVNAYQWIKNSSTANAAGKVKAEWFDPSGAMSAKGHLALAKFIMSDIGLTSSLTGTRLARVWTLNQDRAERGRVCLSYALIFDLILTLNFA